MIVPWQAPLYLGGMIAYMVSNAICIVLLEFARYSMLKKNQTRMKDGSKAGRPAVMTDITDVEDPNFIYRL